MSAWLDAHNHLHDARLGDVGAVVAAMLGDGVKRCVVNATCEGDWRAVASLADRFPDLVVPAFGIHPWKADSVSDGWEGRLAEMLERYPQASVGEVGLDRWVDSPGVEVQRSVFEAQLRLARERDVPVSIHCLKAWGPLFEVLEACPPPERFLMHSFNGAIEVAERLIPMGAFFSFSGYFLQNRKVSVVEVFRQLPLDRILLETDAPDMAPPEEVVRHPLADGLNHPANLSAVGARFAEHLGMSSAELAQLTMGNGRRFFKI